MSRSILSATNVIINRMRVWLESEKEKELDAALADVEYKSANGLGLHVQHNAKLPQRDKIILENNHV